MDIWAARSSTLLEEEGAAASCEADPDLSSANNSGIFAAAGVDVPAEVDTLEG